jgi:hypothetical protein
MNEKIIELFTLCKKYEDIGLHISIEFDRFGILIRGYWDRGGIARTICFNKRYSEYLFKESNIELDIESMIDDFKKEIESEWQKREDRK